MISQIKKFMVVFSVLCAAQANGSIESLFQWILTTEAGETEVVIIGDLHVTMPNEDRANRDALHQRLFMQQLEQWKKNKTLFLLEATEGNYKNIKKDQKRCGAKNDLITCLADFSKAQNMKYEALDFKWSDFRSDSTHHFLDFVLLYQGLPNNFAFASIFEEAIKNREKKTVEDLLEDIRSSVDSIDIFQKKYHTDSPLVAIMQKYKISLARSYQVCKGVFVKKESDLQLDCARAFRNKLLGPESADLMGICEPLMWDMADSGYIMEIERNKNKYNSIVLFVGTGHVGPVNEYLQAIGARCINKVGLASKNKEEFPPTESIFRVLRNCFERITSSHTSSSLTVPGDASQVEALSDLTRPEKVKESCCLCQKSVEGMKRCSACKTARYCSADCQKKDWSVHKLICKK